MTHEDLLEENVSPSSNLNDQGEANVKEKLVLIGQILEKLQSDLNKAFRVLSDSDREIFRSGSHLAQMASNVGSVSQEGENRIIEGVFDGQNMVGPDGKQYSVPANYASKSKLVEGDVLKLTIQPDGRFVYKQIGPQERVRLKGILEKDLETGDFLVLAEGQKYKVILASVTYFKGESGDEVIILVPKEKNSAWAAVENVVKVVDSIASKNLDSKFREADLIDEIKV